MAAFGAPAAGMATLLNAVLEARKLRWPLVVTKAESYVCP
jgi:hypothetical protein